MRPYKPYSPKGNVASEISDIAASFSIAKDKPFQSSSVKFEFLNKCFQTLEHAVPNSMLYNMKTVGTCWLFWNGLNQIFNQFWNFTEDVIKFYETPIDPRIPLDKFQEAELPENLHIQYDYVRFHPETDTKFGGVSAFPKSSTMVTGLKYKDKYKGYKAKTSWP